MKPSIILRSSAMVRRCSVWTISSISRICSSFDKRTPAWRCRSSGAAGKERLVHTAGKFIKGQAELGLPETKRCDDEGAPFILIVQLRGKQITGLKDYRVVNIQWDPSLLIIGQD